MAFLSSRMCAVSFPEAKVKSVVIKIWATSTKQISNFSSIEISHQFMLYWYVLNRSVILTVLKNPIKLSTIGIKQARNFSSTEKLNQFMPYWYYTAK